MPKLRVLSCYYILVWEELEIWVVESNTYIYTEQCLIEWYTTSSSMLADLFKLAICINGFLQTTYFWNIGN